MGIGGGSTQNHSPSTSNGNKKQWDCTLSNSNFQVNCTTNPCSNWQLQIPGKRQWMKNQQRFLFRMVVRLGNQIEVHHDLQSSQWFIIAILLKIIPMASRCIVSLLYINEMHERILAIEQIDSCTMASAELCFWLEVMMFRKVWPCFLNFIIVWSTRCIHKVQEIRYCSLRVLLQWCCVWLTVSMGSMKNKANTHISRGKHKRSFNNIMAKMKSKESGMWLLPIQPLHLEWKSYDKPKTSGILYWWCVIPHISHSSLGQSLDLIGETYPNGITSIC